MDTELRTQNMQRESDLTQILLQKLQDGDVWKLTKERSKANFNLEVGDNSFRADIFISLLNSKDKIDHNAHFIAIEVKIKDWMQGLYQAWRYNSFAEKSYLALFRPYADNIDINLFKKYNVGLIVFDEESINILNVPNNNHFQGKLYSLQLRERLLKRLARMESTHSLIEKTTRIGF